MSIVKVLKTPPRIKILEALGSIGDNRVVVLSDNEAVVHSSTGEREYKVIVSKTSDNEYLVYSNDNGTIYRGYVGYPIIAFLMVKGVIPIDKTIMKTLVGIPWKELNERYKNYSIVEKIVLDKAEESGVSRDIIYDYMNIVMKKLGLLKIVFDEKLSRG